MAIPRIGGGGFALNLNGAFASQLPLPGGQTAASAQFTAGVANASNAVTLPSGGCFILPAGTFYVSPGPVTSLQFLDPVGQFWRTVNSTPYAGGFNIDSDGGNIRLANLSGCVIGGLITAAGTTMTNGIGAAVTGITITPSTGGSVWVPVVGGTNSTAIVITAAGTNYSFPPLLVVSPPPPGGIQATAVVSTLTAGSCASVVFVNQGAGYTSSPSITVLNDYRDNAGSGMVLTPGPLTGSGILTAMYPSGAQNASFVAGTGGNGLGGQTTVPTFTFAPLAGVSATAIMNFCVTGLTVTTGGSGFVAGSFLAAMGGVNASITRATALGANSTIADFGLTVPRPAWIQPLLNSGSVSTTGSVILDPGFGFQAVPTVTGFAGAGGGVPSSNPNITAIVGGQSDTSWVMPF